MNVTAMYYLEGHLKELRRAISFSSSSSLQANLVVSGGELEGLLVEVSSDLSQLSAKLEVVMEKVEGYKQGEEYKVSFREAYGQDPVT